MKTIPQWMRDEVAEYDLNIEPAPTTILDIGANIGAFARHYTTKWPSAKFSCYEPIPENVQELIHNTKPFEDRIAVFQMAVRAKSGDAEIFIGDNFATNSFFQLGRQTDIRFKVPCHAATFIPSHELVKIDTEGCEVEIILTLDFSRTRAVVVEYHSQADRNHIANILNVRGFVLLQEIPGSKGHGVLKFGKDTGVTVPEKKLKPIVPSGDRKVYLATVAHFANFDHAYLTSLLHFAIQPTIKVELARPCCDPSVERARNILTANFLASDCTHILFVDADIGFHPRDVARIASHSEPVVGGLYPLKNCSPEVQWCGNGLKPGESPTRADGLTEVKYIGTGFLCIARGVFETMVARGIAEKYKQDFPPHREEFAFWTQGVREGRFLTEDWMFCQRWLEIGGRIFADSQVVLRHAGRAEWPLPFQKGNPFNQNQQP